MHTARKPVRHPKSPAQRDWGRIPTGKTYGDSRIKCFRERKNANAVGKTVSKENINTWSARSPCTGSPMPNICKEK